MQSLRVRLLGDLQVEGLDASRLGRRQVRALLKVSPCITVGPCRSAGWSTAVAAVTLVAWASAVIANLSNALRKAR